MKAVARLKPTHNATLWSTEPPDNLVLSIKDWAARDLPPLDRLLGELLSTTSRGLIVGPTGLGKTKFGLAMAFCLAAGLGFLHWAGPLHPRRILYIDGEMSRRQLKKRILEAAEETGVRPEGLLILSREDAEDMPPLNTEEGRQWMDSFIEKTGPLDLIIFDNLQALLIGDMKDEEQWAEILPWAKSLTRRAIGQVWFHHTGHDEGKSYGSKAREWQMDVVILMERIQDLPKGELWFSIKFTKARERNQDNLEDFEEITIRLVSGQWSATVGGATSAWKPSGNSKTVFDALIQVLAREGKTPPANNYVPPHTPCVSEALVRDHAFKMMGNGETKVKNQAIKRGFDKLVDKRWLGRWDGQLWAIKTEER